MRYLILDVETTAIADAATYLTEPVEAPSNYKDPVKIAAYIEEAKKKQLEDAALDIDLARIVCFGWKSDASQETFTAKDQTQEMTILGRFWDSFFPPNQPQHWHTLITFHGMRYDVPLLLRRSLYLGVRAPKLQLDRYKHPEVIDLADILSLDGRMTWHSLKFYAHRFGIPVDDENTGADIGALVQSGDWAAVEKHCAADVATTYALAKRIGVLG